MIDLTTICAISFFSIACLLFVCNFVRRTIYTLRHWVADLVARHIIYPVFIRQRRFFGPFTRFHLLLLTVFWAFSISCTLVGIQSMADARLRTGTMSVINLTFLLVSQPSLVADSLGLSLDSYLKAHGAVAWMAFIQALAHVAISMKMEGLSVRGTSQLHGILAFSAFGFAILLLCLRRHFYEFFIKLHYALGFFAVYAVWRHVRARKTFSHVYIFAGIVCFACTFMLHMIKLIGRNFGPGRCFARASFVARNDAVEIVLSSIKPFRFRPGQFIYLRILTMNKFSILQSHPFAITWCSETQRGHADTISLLATDRGDFTHMLVDHAATKKSCLACVDGPYGDTIDLSPYGSVVMFATGIGIAAQIPFIKEIVESRLRWESPTRRLSVVWEVDHQGQLDWVFNWMQELLDKDKGNYVLRISIFHSNPSADPESRGDHDRIFISPQRMNVKQVLDEELRLGKGRVLVTVAAHQSVRGAVRDSVLHHMSRLKNGKISEGQWETPKKDINTQIQLMEKVMKAFIRSAEVLRQENSSIESTETRLHDLLHSIESVWRALSLPRRLSQGVERVQSIELRELSFQPDEGRPSTAV
ncbi:hypothetical protein AJ80_09403 [Polytolypa hystricis UAMH7299]|uniref:ferric-chelate reductase (NADPH) n=1 Tax=Polytolypa hystricis (strain UAMH7299) TaxID=1447883 RepID=A0A2B7WRE2_POLH7|nr:hypothetical protein AJ80_09403 [Polytolypa hystricis UAMH7299]